MSVSTLTLALSVFQQNSLRVISVGKSHKDNYHLIYRLHGVNRVMLVPKTCERPQQLQSEVETLIKRTLDEQKKVGHLDAKE
jgi:hypothetical protein